MKNDMNNKEFVGESEAKAIVRGFMRQYRYTIGDLQNALRMIWQNSRKPTTVAKREELLKKKFAKYGKGIICKRGLAPFTQYVTFFSVSFTSDAEPSPIVRSQTEKKRLNKVAKEHRSHVFKLHNQFYHSFIVRCPDRDTLSIFMFSVYADNKKEVGTLMEIVTITKHCLERVIERLNLKSVDAALDEMLSGLQNMYNSNRELMYRLNDESTFFRHIPTQNGALLMSTHTIEEQTYQSDLITWIHKKQFFKDQEVTDSEFNFVQHVNRQLLNPDRTSVIVGLKETLKEMEQEAPESAEVYILINTRQYLLKEYIAALEKGEYLDFMIDFEQYKH